jgi:hypothetical protein
LTLIEDMSPVAWDGHIAVALFFLALGLVVLSSKRKPSLPVTMIWQQWARMGEAIAQRAATSKSSARFISRMAGCMGCEDIHVTVREPRSQKIG